MPDKGTGNILDIRSRRLNRQDETIEIDLLELLFELKKRWLIVLCAIILGGGLGYTYSAFVLTPTYNSTSMIYVMSKETTLTSLTDLQIGSQLTADYKVLVTSRTVMENVIQRLNLDMDYLELRKIITIDNPTGTRILNLTILDTDSVRVKQIADAVAECASEYIADIMEQSPPKIIEYGEVPLREAGPKKLRNAGIGAFVLLFVVVAGVALSVVTNDTIKTEDDIQKFFETPVLAAVPEKNAGGDSHAYGPSYGPSKSGNRKSHKTGKKGHDKE